jgi:hypothetical protein
MAGERLSIMIKIWKRVWLGFLLAVAVVMTLSTTGCGGNVYVGVGIAGPYYGYPYPGGPYPVGVGGWYGRPIY